MKEWQWTIRAEKPKRENTTMNLIQVASLCNSDKLEHGYIEIYDNIFSSLKDDKINFLEIGVYGGASAELWNRYFSNANIFMSDIFDKTDILSKVDVNFFRGDSGNEKDTTKLLEFAKAKTGTATFDIIIDDGSHFQHDQMNGIGNLFPYLTSGGYYIIEDICYEEDLKNGSMWWGHSKEPHHSVPGPCHAGAQLRTDEEWLAGSEKDFAACTDATIKRYAETNVFSSKYLSDSKNKYITDNVERLEYHSNDTGLDCTSKLAVFKKR